MVAVRDYREPVLLGGYAAKQCPVRTQIEFHPLLGTVAREWTPEEEARFEAGREFEDVVFGRLRALHPDAVSIEPEMRQQEAITRTLAAMDSGAPLILGGWLPDDEAGGRKGKPDILIRLGDGYLAADVKNHTTLQSAKRKTASVSRLGTPADRFELEGFSAQPKHRFNDGIQLAHYTRMLQACGHHAGPPVGAIVGTSKPILEPGEEPNLALVWHDLEEPLYETFSRSEGKKRRSLLERYDHEHQFRIAVAQNALRIVGGAGDPLPLVQPIGQSECEQCPFDQWCREQMDPADPSAAITKGRLSAREYLTLRRLGIQTTSALAVTDPDDPEFFDAYFSEVSNQSRAEARKRLALAIRRAQMIDDGIALARHDHTALHVPSADIEIDFDIENDADNRVYMWGVRIRRGTDDSTARYLPDFISWEPLDESSERELGRKFIDWLRAQCDAATAAGETIAVFHWSNHEIARLRSILGLAEIGDLIHQQTGVFVDLRKVFESNFFSLHGSRLKVVAPIFDFTWRVDDPSGSGSQLYLSKVHNGDESEAADARRWLLSYNEDDTAATAAIRDGMRTWDGECPDRVRSDYGPGAGVTDRGETGSGVGPGVSALPLSHSPHGTVQSPP